MRLNFHFSGHQGVRWVKSIALFAVLFFAVGYWVADAQEIEPAKPKPTAASLNASISYRVSSSYRVGVGDILSVSVYPQEEFSSSDVTVRSDGTVTFSRVGEFSAVGKTIGELTSEVNGELSRSLRNHNVTINVTSSRPAIFYMTGAVNKQGPFQMSTSTREQSTLTNETSLRRSDMILTNIIANSGGVRLNADLSVVQVKHPNGDAKTVNLWKVLKEGSINDDLWLDPGDTVYVPELPQAVMSDEDFKVLVNSVLAPKNFPVRVIGEVRQPTLVRMEGDSPLLSSAIALSGGYAPQALKKVVAVRRFTDENHFVTLFVDTQKLDFMLRPNDVVFVGENKLYKTSRFMQTAATVLAPFTEAAVIGGNAAQVFGIGGWRNFSQ